MPLKELVADTKVIRDLTFIMCTVAALLEVVIGYLIILHIGNPLLQISYRLNEGARGNLDVRLTFKRKDEIGEVAESFKIMMQQMKSLPAKRS
jgi:methyl-accepting chemotaxis protein